MSLCHGILLAGLMMGIGTIVVAAESGSGPEANLLRNSGFEQEAGTKGAPEAWDLAGKNKDMALVDREGQAGKKSLQITASETPTGVSQIFSYDGQSKLYKLCVGLKTDLKDTTRVFVGVDYYDKDGKWLGEEDAGAGKWILRHGLFTVCGKTDWQRYVVYFRRLPEGTAKIKVWCTVNLWETPSAGGRAWVDDLTVAAVTPDPKWPMGYPAVQWKPGKAPEWSPAANKSGYVVYPVNATRFIIPDMTPDTGYDTLSISTATFPSDTEPLTFCVHALKDLEGVRVTLSDLVSANDKEAKIAASNVDIRQVHYLYKKLYYLSYEYLMSPIYLENFDSAAVAKGKTQEFWLTLKTPGDAKPGKYEGMLNIHPANAPAKQMRVAVDVFPVKLMEPKGMFWGMYAYAKEKEALKAHYADMRAHGMTTVGHCGNLDAKIDKTADGKIQVTWDYNKGMAMVLDTYRDAGFTEPMVWLMSGDVIAAGEKFGGVLGSEAFAKTYKDVMAQFIAEGKKCNWPDIYYVPYDESYPYPFTEKRIEATRACVRVMKEMGLKTAVHAENQPIPSAIRFTREFSGLVDMHLLTFCHPPVCVSEKFMDTSSWAEFRDKAKQKGQRVLFYNIDNTGINPEAMRFGYGIVQWKQKAEGMIDWAYQCPASKDPYDDTSLQFGRSQWMFYYSPDAAHAGGPTVGWEAAREGVKDYKLLYTLDQLAGKAGQSGDAVKKATARNAMKEVTALLDKMQVAQMNPNSMQALPGQWDKEEYDQNGKMVTGEYKIPTGFALDDYRQLRAVLLKYITELQ